MAAPSTRTWRERSSFPSGGPATSQHPGATGEFPARLATHAMKRSPIPYRAIPKGADSSRTATMVPSRTHAPGQSGCRRCHRCHRRRLDWPRRPMRSRCCRRSAPRHRGCSACCACRGEPLEAGSSDSPLHADPLQCHPDGASCRPRRDPVSCARELPEQAEHDVKQIKHSRQHFTEATKSFRSVRHDCVHAFLGQSMRHTGMLPYVRATRTKAGHPAGD